jgi:hypothetical protein
MKHDDLRSIAHNITDSLASGCGLMIGVYDMDVFGEAAKSREGLIKVDFLNGAIIEGQASPSLAKAVQLYSQALRGQCENQGASVSSFRELTAEFFRGALATCVHVTVEDQNGRRTTDEYAGTPLRRIKVLDNLGRIRPKPGVGKSS